MSYHFGKLLSARFRWHPDMGLKFNGFFIVAIRTKQKKILYLFCLNLDFFFERGIMSPKTNVLGPWRETYGNDPGTVKFLQKCILFRKQPPTFFLFLTLTFKFFQQKFLKKLRIQHDLESKKFKFLNLKVRNEKKIGGYFLKKMHFWKIFSVPEPVT